MTESYIKKLTFTSACLSYVRVLIAIMRISFVEWLCQTAMRLIPALEYLLTGTSGLLRPRPVARRQ
jgi:hypothetical protein